MCTLRDAEKDQLDIFIGELLSIITSKEKMDYLKARLNNNQYVDVAGAFRISYSGE